MELAVLASCKLLTLNMPALMVTAPVNVFAAVKTIVPAAALVIPKFVPLLITPLMVRSVAVVPSSATVNVRVAPNAIGHETVAPLVPVPTSVTATSPPSVKVPVPVIEEPVVEDPHSKATLVCVDNEKFDNASVAAALMVKIPDTVVVAPKVVVPPEQLRLLKEVTTVAGNVLVTFITTEPVPGVHVFVPDPTVVKAPFIFNVPPEVIVIVDEAVVVVFPN